MKEGTRPGSPVHPILRIPEPTLDDLIRTLEVNSVTLFECLVSSGWRVSVPASEMPSIHYNVSGSGVLTIGDGPPITLTPHTLIVIPPRLPPRIGTPLNDVNGRPLGAVETRLAPASVVGSGRRNSAGESDPQILLICGFFRALYGASIDLFSLMGCPIVERFEEGDQLEGMLKAALTELIAQQVGAGAMTSALLKQVLVKLLRRSLVSASLWVERFSILGDPQIARAFSDMVSRPGAPHSVQALSRTAGLSRSIFMARFVTIFGRPPMTVLRELRIHQASLMLDTGQFSVNQVAHRMGYKNRTTFIRSFQKAHGKNPSEEKARANHVRYREHRHGFAVPGDIRVSASESNS
jgi:AraC family transcriptional activator of mtrCDE